MRVSIIVVTYNAQATIRGAILSLQNQSYKDYEIIIVDNNSHDNTVSIVRELFAKGNKESYKVICNNTNTGFAGGSVTGYKHAAGEYIVLLNADAEAESNWLQSFVDAMGLQEEAGICASKLVVHGTDKIDSAGDSFSKTMKGFKRGEGREAKEHTKKEYVFGACAGAALYRREMLDDIGFFDKDFFLIYEDTDLNLRAQLAGWKVMYVPAAIVHHKVRSSIGKMSELAAYYSLRNSELVRFKNIPFGVFLLCLPQFLTGMVSEFIYFTIKHRFFRIYFKAKFDALKLLPKMLKKRKEILKKRKVSNKHILGIMTPLLERNFIKSKIEKLLYD
jgi:GT2 family glycosyltransferase